MARIRSVKPEFWTNSTTGHLSGAATKLYLGLHNHSDDYGVGRYEPDELRVKILPYEKGGLRTLTRAFDELELAGSDENPYGLVVRFRVLGKRFYWLPYFTKHQRVDHRGDPLLEGWDTATNPDGYANTENETGTVQEQNGNDPAGVERSGEDKSMSSSADVAEVWNAFHHHHPRAAFSTTGKNHRKGIIERALRTHSVETCVAAIEGIHTSDYHVENGHSGNLELILRDVDHVEKYAAMAPRNGQHLTTPEEMAEIERKAIAAGFKPGTAEDYALIVARSRGEA